MRGRAARAPRLSRHGAGPRAGVGRVRRRRPDAVGGAGAAAAARRDPDRARVQGAGRHRAREAQDGDVGPGVPRCSCPDSGWTSRRDRARAGARARTGVRGRGRLGGRGDRTRLRDAARLLDPIFASAITLPPNGFWERREVGRLRSLLPKPTHRPVRAAAAGAPVPRRWRRSPAVHGAALVAHDIGPISEARAFESRAAGSPRFEGGLAALQALLLGRLETFGADRRERLTPVEIVVRRGRVAGLRVRPRDETIGCHHLLWAGSAAGLVAALAPDAVAPHKRPAAARVTGYRYGIAALVEPDALPADMPSRLLAIGDPSRAADRGQRRRDHGRTADRRAIPRRIPLWIECGVPAQPRRGGPELPALAARAGDARACGACCPDFAAAHLIVLASPYDGLPAERRGTPVPETTPPASLPTAAAARRWSACRRRGRWTSSALPHATAVKNLYLVGRENLPGLGLEGDLISGWGVRAPGELRPRPQAPVAAPDPDRRVTRRSPCVSPRRSVSAGSAGNRTSPAVPARSAR